MRVKPEVCLVGEDGNAFMVLGLCLKAARAAGWTPEELDDFHHEATQGSYDHLLQTALKYFEVR